jgi:hypothetical protein
MFRTLGRAGRPSAPLGISVVALFFALGGAGWAAFHVPRNSVGTAQLQRGAVTGRKIRAGAVSSRKIAFRAVGIRRINPTMVQARVLGTCPGGSAVGSVRQNGTVSCNVAGAPKEFGTSGSAHGVGTAGTQIARESLGRGSYMILANPYATISGTAGHVVEVSCTLSASNASGGQTRTVVVDITSTTQHHEVAIPLQAPVEVRAPGGTASLTCAQSPAASGTASVQGALDALQTASNS